MSFTRLIKKIALVDCNSFYVSCERLFKPKIQYRPVVVLSNNDGCVISRSKEAKKLGIKMGVPVFKIKKIIEKFFIKNLFITFLLLRFAPNQLLEVLLKVIFLPSFLL